jgi:hypothetical protein
MCAFVLAVVCVCVLCVDVVCVWCFFHAGIATTTGGSCCVVVSMGVAGLGRVVRAGTCGPRLPRAQLAAALSVCVHQKLQHMCRALLPNLGALPEVLGWVWMAAAAVTACASIAALLERQLVVAACVQHALTATCAPAGAVTHVLACECCTALGPGRGLPCPALDVGSTGPGLDAAGCTGLLHCRWAGSSADACLANSMPSACLSEGSALGPHVLGPRLWAMLWCVHQQHCSCRCLVTSRM